KEWQNVSALESTANDYISRRVNAVDLKNRFGDVETDCRDRLHLGSSESWGPQQHPHPWHFRAGGGAVHSIKSGQPHRSKKAPLFDHFVGRRLQRERHSEAECIRGL